MLKEQQIRSSWLKEGQEYDLSYTPTSGPAAHEFDRSDYRKTVRDAGHHPIWAWRGERILLSATSTSPPKIIPQVLSAQALRLTSLIDRGLKAEFDAFHQSRSSLGEDH